MIRIWAKIVTEEKIIKDLIYQKTEYFDPAKFQTYLEEMCHELDIGTPIILSKHLEYFLTFNNTSFAAADFAENINFDKFIIEDASNY